MRPKLNISLPQAHSSTKHERVHRVTFNEEQIKALLVFAAGDACIEHFSVNVNAPGVTSRVTLTREDRGSEGFRTEAVVTITEDLLPQDASSNRENDRG